MLSAHGSTPDVVLTAEGRASVAIDSVCPLVTKVHHEASRMAAQGYHILYVGKKGHDEAVGVMGEVEPNQITLLEPKIGLGALPPAGESEKVALLAQTTLALQDWDDVHQGAQERFPGLKTARKSDVCYATTNRQGAVAELVEQADLILVVGSENSSNTYNNRLI